MNALRPRIAIPEPHSARGDYTARSLPDYQLAIEAAGGEPVIIRLSWSNAEIERAATHCHGVLLPGSPADVHPQKYAAERDSRTADPDPLRDNADELLIQDAFNMGKPLLGICYGAQSLNVWRTGTLVQHIESQIEHAPKDKPPRAHTTHIQDGTQLAKILRPVWPELHGWVNSSHHQAVDSPGDGLRIAARADDGVAEAVELAAADHFVLGVQWHPERLPDDPASQAIFRAFLNAAHDWRERASRSPDYEYLPG